VTYTPIPHGTENWDVPVNAAFTSQDQRITVLEDLQPEAEVYVPPDWGQFWRPARNASGTQASKIMVAGASVAEGYYAQNTITDSWVGKMRTAVQGTYGDGGSGMFSSSRTDVISSATAGAVATWEGNGSFATTTGTWTTGAQFFGPGISFMISTAAATATYKVTGSTVKIYNISGAAPRANYTYQIDGGAIVPVTVTIGTTSIQVTTVTGLAPVEHTVVISWNGAPTEPLSLIGVAGENSTGCIVDNLGRAGTTSANWSSASALTQQWNGGPSNPCDLFILHLGANDATSGTVDSETFMRNMSTILLAVKDGAFGQDATGDTDIMIVTQHFGHFTNPSIYAGYSTRMKGLADTFGAAYVNIWGLGRNSWAYWNGLGYWGNANTPGPAGTDNVHPSNAGHDYISSIINPIVMS